MTLFDKTFVRGFGSRSAASNVFRSEAANNILNGTVQPSQTRAAQGAGETEMSSGGDDKSSMLTPVVALADKRSARIIGVTSCQSNAGVSVIARKLAQAFSSFGRRSLLVDASRLVPIAPVIDRNGSTHSDRGIYNPVCDGQIDVLDLATVPDWPVDSREECRKALDGLARNSYTVIVDLPPIIQPSGKPTLLMASAGAACDLTFLVCLSGKTERSPLNAAVEAAGIFGMTMGGIILNDWQLPMNGMLKQ